jgi:hypothetical protein
MNQGVMYIATGQTYIEEGLKSIASLKAATPSAHVTLFCDAPVTSPCVDNVVRVNGSGPPDPTDTLNAKVSRTKGGMFNKVFYMSNSPYERTIYLDTDTYVVSDISDLFPLLDRFDIAAAHAPYRSPHTMAQRKKSQRIPASFVVMNTGVVAFKKSPRMEAFFSAWMRSYEEDVTALEYNDQTSFREALYDSDLRIATLTPEYNYRFHKRLCINGSLKILHGRHPDLPLIAKRADALVARGIAPALVASGRLNLVKRLLSARKVLG